MRKAAKLRRAFAPALLGFLLAATAAFAAEPYDIHVILPLTGGASFVGKGQQANLTLIEGAINQAGGIKGRPLHLIYHDDQTSPQVAVQLANEILATKPQVFIGPSIVAMCNAVAPLMKDGPLMYCLSPGIHPAAGSYVFSASVSTFDLIATLTRFYRLKGWTKIAVITSTDASGQDADRAIEEIFARPENKSITKIRHEHFNPSDVSVQAQIERIKGAEPQALIAWTTGAPVATVFKAIVQAGLDVPVGITNGNQTFAQMAQYADFMPKQLYMPTSLFPEHQGVLSFDPKVEAVQQSMYKTLAAGGVKSDNMTGTSWDALLVIVDALQHLGPDATSDQLRQYIDGLTGFPGVNGMYDFKAVPQRGLSADGAAIVRYDAKDKAWAWLSKPGGEPLGK